MAGRIDLGGDPAGLNAADYKSLQGGRQGPNNMIPSQGRNRPYFGDRYPLIF